MKRKEKAAGFVSKKFPAVKNKKMAANELMRFLLPGKIRQY